MITGSISDSDYLQAQRLHRKSVAKWSNISAVALCALGLVALAAGFKALGAIGLFAGIGAFIGEYVVARIYLPRKVKKIHGQQKDLASHFSYTWDTSHIEVKSAIGAARRPWTHYVKVKEDENIFLLYHSDHMFEMLPKSWFPSSEAIDAFRELALRPTET